GGKVGSEPRPHVDVCEGIRTARTETPLVIMRKKFSFVSSDVHADRTLALAPFAGKTKIERMLDVMVMPSVANDIALSHLPEQVRAPAGRVLLLASDTKAGTHDAAVILPALPHPDAAQSGLGQAAM